MLSTTVVYLIALFTQALLYGLYIATLLHYIQWLVVHDKGGWVHRYKINWLIFSATIFTFLLSTVHLSSSLRLQLHLVNGTVRGWNLTWNIMLDGSHLMAIMTVDAILIYRCWVVYTRSWHSILLPVLFWLGGGGLAMLAIYHDARVDLTKGKGEIWRSNSERAKEEFASMAFVACSIVTTIYTTFAIVYRIIHVTRTNGNRTRGLYNSSRIISESGALYTAISALAVVGIALDAVIKSEKTALLREICIGMNLPIAGIAFNLIIIRVYSARSDTTDSSVELRNADRKQDLSTLRFHSSVITEGVQSELFQDRQTDI